MKQRFSCCNVSAQKQSLSFSTEDLITDVSNFYTVIVLPTQLQPCSEETENIGSEFEWLTTLTVFFLR